jgi:hypothetical protein
MSSRDVGHDTVNDVRQCALMLARGTVYVQRIREVGEHGAGKTDATPQCAARGCKL